MNIRAFAKAVTISAVVLGLASAPGFAAQGYCKQVGGGILTNFLPGPPSPDCAASPLGLCTDGVATGDLSGAVGVSVLSESGNVLHNHHHWVTTSGGTITFDDADLTLLANANGQYLGNYLKGVTITGGTGAFAGASGNLSSVFGAIDLNKGELTLRYAGTICLAPAKGD